MSPFCLPFVSLYVSHLYAVQAFTRLYALHAVSYLHALHAVSYLHAVHAVTHLYVVTYSLFVCGECGGSLTHRPAVKLPRNSCALHVQR